MLSREARPPPADHNLALFHDENPLNPLGRAGKAPVPVHPWNGATGLGQRKIVRAGLTPHPVGLDLECDSLTLG
jgi:hypothetical protein